LSLVFSLSLAGCGTLLHPHRNGHHGDRVDPAIVLLDGALLLFFVVPGLVAYGIDFYTGAIYLPGHGRRHAGHADHAPRPGLPEDVCVIQLDPGELTEARVEALVREHTGAEFRIDDPRLQRLRMEPARGLRMLSAAGSSPAG